MQKTVKEWLEECTEPWAAKALYAMKKYGTASNNANSLSEALIYSFDWSETSEGHAFWYNIHLDLRKKELNEKDV